MVKMRIHRLPALLLWFCLPVLPALGQTEDFLDTVLGARSLTWSQSAHLVLVGAGFSPEDATPEASWATLTDRGWVSPLPDPQKPATVAGYAFLVTKAFGLKGGFLSSLVPGPRYAFRDLKFHNLVPEGLDPDDPLDPRTALVVLADVMASHPETGVAP